MFKCLRCPTLDARILQLTDSAFQERRLLAESAERERAAFAAERAAWSKEREQLLTRVQGWAPQGTPEEPPAAKSRGTDELELVDGIHTQEELSALGLVYHVDPDSGDRFYMDVRLNPPCPYETVEDCIEVRALLKAKGLPDNAHPALMSDYGLQDVIQAAREFRKETTAKEEDPNHAV